MKWLVAVAGLSIAGLILAAPPAISSADGSRGAGRQPAGPLLPIVQTAPKHPARPKVLVGGDRYPAANPYLALVPRPAGVDWSFWKRSVAKRSAAVAAQRQTAAVDPFLYDEREPAGIRGSNDSRRTAEPIGGFGTGGGENPAVLVLGNLVPDRVDIRDIARFGEDNGSIPLAGRTGVGNRRAGIRTPGTVGDGRHGAGGDRSGDFDFLRVRVPRGKQVVVDINTPGNSEFDSIVAVYDAEGEVVAFNDDDVGSFDSFLEFRPSQPGRYYVAVGGFGRPLLRDPFDSGSGFGMASRGDYRVTVKVNEPDLDHYSVRLDAGDVLGGILNDSGSKITVHDPSGLEVFGSEQDASFIYPGDTVLPGGGRAVVSHVASVDGRYTVLVSGRPSGNYRLQVEAYRPGVESDPAGAVQTLFLDFDGARVNTGIFGGPGVRDLSPLSGFLGQWGLRPAQQGPLIDAIVATVRENVRRDLARRGQNDDFAVRILNSRDDPDPWGEPNVSRLVVGGTIAESEIPMIGIAQSIDPGNFEQEETALVLLDVLSSPRDGGFGDASLNFYMRPSSNRVGFVGQAVGNLVAHEAGHYLGNWHVDQFDHRANLMDQGNFRLLYGVGPDGIGGTADDRDVDFGKNALNPFEGFTGIEDTLNVTAFGLTTGRAP